MNRYMNRYIKFNSYKINIASNTCMPINIHSKYSLSHLLKSIFTLSLRHLPYPKQTISNTKYDIRIHFPAKFLLTFSGFPPWPLCLWQWCQQWCAGFLSPPHSCWTNLHRNINVRLTAVIFTTTIFFSHLLKSRLRSLASLVTNKEQDYDH